MSKPDPFENSFHELRKKAEEAIVSKGKKKLKITPLDLEHELSVHKIELEMQNEELQVTQAKLVNALAEYSELFNYAPAGYFILDKNGMIIKVNDTGCKQFGFDNKNIVGKAFSTFLNSELHQDNFFRHKNSVIETESLQQIEGEIRRKDGSVFSALIESTVMKDGQNNFRYFLSMVKDITERKEQERKVELALIREKELNEMKSQFITMASHEFRTPLATILSSADLMARYSDPMDASKKEKHFLKIKSAVGHLKNILSDFLSVQHLEKGIIKNNPALINITDFITEIINELKSNNSTHTILYKHTDQNQLAVLDKTLLQICLINLIGNAIKYSSIGTVIKIISQKDASGKLQITIQDVGVGIPENDQPRIFEKFFKAKNADNVEGVGMGLSITRQMVSLMKGEIAFKSKENEGAKFILTFPG